MADAARVRIGELSRRTGVSPDTLRAWERRYGLLTPERTSGGFRLYGDEDEARVRRMSALISSGVSASEAAARAVEPRPQPDPAAATWEGASNPATRLREALEAFDEPAANSILDAVLTRLTVNGAIEQVLLPAMKQIGDRWEEGAISVAQEHFATGVLRARMLALGRNWGAGSGPLAILACPPGERHDLGLVAFGISLRDRGWRIAYLGADTPVETVARAATELGPAAIVLAALSEEPFEAAADQIATLAGQAPVVLGGGGASAEIAERLGAERLEPNPVGAAAQLTAAAAA